MAVTNITGKIKECLLPRDTIKTIEDLVRFSVGLVCRKIKVMGEREEERVGAVGQIAKSAMPGSNRHLRMRGRGTARAEGPKRLWNGKILERLVLHTSWQDAPSMIAHVQSRLSD